MIDGPPKSTQQNARFPAIPLLYDRLNPGSVVLMDDGARIEERQIASTWQSDFHFDSVEYLAMEKGAWKLVR